MGGPEKCRDKPTSLSKPETKMDMDKLAEELIELKNNHKEFKKENKEVFLEHRNYNKAIKAKEEELIELLKEKNVEHYEYGGMEFELKSNTTEKHDMEQLAQLIGDEEKFNDYRSAIQTTKPKVTTRKKRKRTEEAE